MATTTARPESTFIDPALELEFWLSHRPKGVTAVVFDRESKPLFVGVNSGEFECTDEDPIPPNVHAVLMLAGFMSNQTAIDLVRYGLNEMIDSYATPADFGPQLPQEAA